MSQNKFVSLHNHTSYSLMDSIIKPTELFARAKELDQPAIAVTDHGTLAGAWDCLKASKKSGVKLLMGCEFNFVDKLNDPGDLRHIILIAKNYQGYKNLLKLNKLANDHFIVAGRKVVPRIDWQILEDNSKGLICTTACSGGILGYFINSRRMDEAKKQAIRLKDLFGESLAFEIQPHAMVRNATPYNSFEDQRLVNNVLVDFGNELGVKVVPTCDAHYLTPDQWEMHDALLAIGQSMPVRAKARLKYPVNDFYLKDYDQVMKFLTRHYPNQAEEFCDNTLFFADMCEKPKWIDPKIFNSNYWELPVFAVKEQKDYQEFKIWLDNQSVDVKSKPKDVSYLRYLCEISLEKIGKSNNREYISRVEKELDTFEFRNLSSYMLIVSDYVSWSKDKNLPTGPGRGSVAGSLVAYLLNIHDADSIKYGLIFERFYNKIKEGVSDIDADFGQSAKPLVEKYITDKYGSDKVAHVSNWNTMTPKVYARDIARAFLYGGNRKTAAEVGTSIADAIPGDVESIQKALESAPLFSEYASQERYKELEKFQELSGIVRAISTHAGGVIIGSKPLHEMIPTRRDKDGNYAIEYEKDRAEANGLVKMDILGLSTLDIIQNTFKIIKLRNKPLPPSHWDYDINDSKTYDLIGRGETNGVFQLGTSSGTIELCKQMQPRNIEDLAMINSMARPGFPKEIREQFISDKKQRKVANLIHPILENSLSPTFGYALFDEVLLNLAEDVAGWDLAEADRLRKFVKEKGKYPKKDKQLKEDFIKGGIDNRGLSLEEANVIWDNVISHFGSYIFNKGHAVTYSFLGYQTAFLKAHYPLEFLVANLMFEVDSSAKSSDQNKQAFKNEIRNLGVKILPPNINKSEKTYKILDNNTLLTGLDSLKYIGKDAIPEILSKRPFTSLDDFFLRTDASKVKINSVYALASAGCFDHFGYSRKQICLYGSDYRKKLKTWADRRPEEKFEYPWPEDIGTWSVSEKYAQEVFYLGEGLCCKLPEAYPGFFNNWAIDFSKLPEIHPESNEKLFIPASIGVVQGVITNIRIWRVKKETSKIFGHEMAKMELEDPFGNITSMTLFPGGLMQMQDRLRSLTRGKVELEPGIAIHCAASINWYEGEVSLIFEDLRQVAPIPSRPQNLTPKKVKMVITKRKKAKTKVKKLDPQEFLKDIEDEMIEEGHADIEYD